MLYSQFHKVPLDQTLGTLSRILEKDHFALIVHNQKLCEFTMGYCLTVSFLGCFIRPVV